VERDDVGGEEEGEESRGGEVSSRVHDWSFLSRCCTIYEKVYEAWWFGVASLRVACRTIDFSFCGAQELSCSLARCLHSDLPSI